MDQRLRDRLNAWHDQIETLSVAERTFLELEANEKPLWSQLFLEGEGKTVAEKEAWAYRHARWIDFQKGLIEAKTQYNRERRLLELRQAVFQSDYLETKTSSEAIQKYPRSIT